jgi:hypothetical protein
MVTDRERRVADSWAGSNFGRSSCDRRAGTDILSKGCHVVVCDGQVLTIDAVCVSAGLVALSHSSTSPEPEPESWASSSTHPTHSHTHTTTVR